MGVKQTRGLHNAESESHFSGVQQEDHYITEFFSFAALVALTIVAAFLSLGF